MTKERNKNVKHFLAIFLTTIALILTATSQLVAAGITISLTPASATAGSTGNSFEVDLTNSGSSSVTVGGFSFELSIANPNISLTSANTATTAIYVFSGDSLFGPNISTSSPGQIMDASDIDSILMTGTTINPGSTFGLGRVFFDVSANATPSVTPVNISTFPNTSLSDSLGNNLPIDVLSAGRITIAGTTVPEPSSFLLFFIAAVVLLGRNQIARTLQNLLGKLVSHAVNFPNSGSDSDWWLRRPWRG
jgi:hypothetical protein